MNSYSKTGGPKTSCMSLLLVFSILASVFPGTAHAVGEALPYEAGIDVLITSLQGPVPFIISLVGIVACGAMLIFGGEISGFMRTMVFIVLVVSVIVQASTIISILGLDWKPKASQSTNVLMHSTYGRVS